MAGVGIIDIGSNTVRLSVVDVRPDGAWVVRHEEKAALRLAARLQADGSLGAGAVEDTARVIGDFAAAGADWGVSLWLAVGTAAVRQATDGPQFVREITRRTGVPIRLLPAEEEAALGLVGALNTLDVRDGCAVDIGGGSMEITRFTERRRLWGVSLSVGAVTAARRFGLEDRATARALRALGDALQAEASSVADRFEEARGLPLVGIGGSVRALAKLDRRRRRYPLLSMHNYVLAPDTVLALRAELTAMQARERLHLPGVAADRADLLGAGAALLGWVVERVRPARLLVSGSGLREGLLYRHLLRDRPQPLVDDVLASSVQNLERWHGLPPARGDRLAELASVLWEALGPLAGPAGASLGRLAPVASRLRHLGTTISYYDWERHTAYILREGRLFGVDHRQRLLLAAAAGYDGAVRLREALAPYAVILAPDDERLATCLGITVALAHALDGAARGRAMPLKISVLPSAVRITPAAGPSEGLALERGLNEDFRKTFGRPLGLSASGEA